MFIFELWCEKRKLIGELDLAEAIAAFIHLAFVFDLKYPKVSMGTSFKKNLLFILYAFVL